MTDDYYQPATAAEFARLLFGTQPDQQQATDQQQQADDQQAGSDGSDVQAGPDAHGHEPQQDRQQQATDTDTVDVVRLLRWAQGIDHDDHHDGDGEQPRDPASLVGHALTQSIQQPKPAKQVADEHARLSRRCA